MPTVLITGANRGIGLEFTRVFAAEDWHVHACCRHPERAEELKALSEGGAGAITVHKLDVTEALSVANLSRELAGDTIDILLNNAGVYGPRTGFGETKYDEWLDVFKVNVLAPLRMAERFVDHVTGSQRKLIVNISSRMGSIGDNGSGGAYIYRSSKAALNMVSKSMALDLAERGVTVLTLHPGWVHTDMGGPNATITPQESVDGMRLVIDRATRANNGRFFSFDGTEIPW